MKKHVDLQLLATFGGGILFSYLFWMEKLALNLLLYSVFIIGIFLLDQGIPKSKKFLLVAGSHLLAAIVVVIHPADLSIITWCISLAVFIGFAHFQSLRSIFTALIAAGLQLVTVPVNLFRKLATGQHRNLSFQPVVKPIKYLVIPLIVLIVFTALYSIANPIFAKYLHNFRTLLETIFTHIFNFFFDELSFLRFLHLISGILLAAALFIGFKDKALESVEALYTDKLIRNRKTKGAVTIGYEILAVFAGSLLNRKMALKTENIIGIISFTALNLLLLMLNVIDLSTLLTNYTHNEGSLSAELHDGTNALIISIVMAMLVIIYFFSGNLNFYSKNKSIRLLAYLWIIQNAFLVLSVLLRDYHYIAAHGLTYKRIGVLVFLLLCAIGLITVYLKVAKQKTLFYLIRINSFSWYTLLLAFSMVNWDGFIVKYNIANRNTIALDINHLMRISNQNLSLLLKNKTLLEPYFSAEQVNRVTHSKSSERMKLSTPSNEGQTSEFEKELSSRTAAFRKNYENTSWLSWNLRDWQTHRYLITKQL